MKVDSLKTMLAEAEAEKKTLITVQSENLQLRDQVLLLEKRLSESDEEIRSQLEVYLAEVESFQTTLEDLKAENETGIVQVPVSEMPWDFWSGLLLRIDALMLGELLTQVRISFFTGSLTVCDHLHLQFNWLPYGPHWQSLSPVECSLSPVAGCRMLMCSKWLSLHA